MGSKRTCCDIIIDAKMVWDIKGMVYIVLQMGFLKYTCESV